MSTRAGDIPGRNPLGPYQGVTDQVSMSETPKFYNTLLIPRGSSRAEWLPIGVLTTASFVIQDRHRGKALVDFASAWNAPYIFWAHVNWPHRKLRRK